MWQTIGVIAVLLLIKFAVTALNKKAKIKTLTNPESVLGDKPIYKKLAWIIAIGFIVVAVVSFTILALTME